MILTGISVNQTPLDWEENKNRIIESLTYYSKTKIYENYKHHLILFPELSLSGYGCEDGFLFSDTKKKSFLSLLEIVKFSNKIPKATLFLGLPFYYRGSMFNAMAVIYSGHLLAIIPKTYLAGEGLHYEPRWFTPYQKNFSEIEYNFENQIYKFFFGKGVIEWNSIRIGIEICEDAWVNKRPTLKYYNLDIDILLNPAASHFALEKWNIRRQIAISSSLNFHCYFFSVNLLGNEAGKAIYDGSFLLSKEGNLLFQEQSFSFYDILIRSFRLNFTELRNKRDRVYSRRKERKLHLNEFILKIESKKEMKKPIFYLESESQNLAQFKACIHYQHIETLSNLENHQKDNTQFIEFLEVERLGLFDYLRKTHSKGYTISLSGGADSSTVAILVYQMIRKGIYELGFNSFLRKINLQIPQEEYYQISNLHPEEQIQYLSKKIIFTIYQKTNQNSEQTKELAEELAKEICSTHYTINIQDLLEENLSLLENAFHTKFDWQNHNIALQNIQARIRSPIAWFLANLTNTILISTSNRSEGSVGYATMDGDTSGGIAPLAGIHKPFILKFLKFISTYEDQFTKPILTAKKILEQPPTAELLPLEQNQTDETDLMPYPILHLIERLAIESLLSPEEILDTLIKLKEKNLTQTIDDDLKATLNNYSIGELKAMINKFFDLWNKNQWKRERIATSFHIDTYHIDPRGWFRFPVISGKLKIIE